MPDDLTPDPTLRAALQRHLPQPPVGAVDFDALEARVMSQVRSRAGARGAEQRSIEWWQFTARWARATLPLLAAASLLLAVSLRGSAPNGAESDTPSASAIASTASPRTTALLASTRAEALELAVVSDGDAQMVRVAMIGDAATELLLRAVWER